MRWAVNFGGDKSPCRVNHASVSIDDLILSFGGYCQHSTFNELKTRKPIDVHVLNTNSFKWHKRPVPAEKDSQFNETPYFRYGHTCVVYNNHIYLWGGRSDWTNTLCNNLFSYNPSKHVWKMIEITGDKPDGRDGHSACVKNDSMYIFGGFVQKIKRFTNDIHEFNFITSSWNLIVPKNEIRPFWRDFHTASIIDDNMYIFGGRMDVGQTRFTGENFYSNDLYSFNLVTKKWTELIPYQSTLSISNEQTEKTNEAKFTPLGRRSHSAVVYNNKLIIFGGFQENIQKHFNDLNEYDPVKNEWRVLNATGIAPSPRRRHGCNIVNKQMIIFGGTGPAAVTNALVPATTVTNVVVPATVVNPIINDNLDQNNLPGNNNQFERLLLNFMYAQNMVRDRVNIDLDELNNALIASRIRLNNLRNNNNIPLERLPPPQNEFDTNSNELNMQLVEQNEENTNNNDNDNSVNNQNIVEVIEDDEIEFYDSDSEDLINEETDEEDDTNAGLVSLSDLHVLELEVPSLKLVTKLTIIKEKITYDSLPKNLINALLRDAASKRQELSYTQFSDWSIFETSNQNIVYNSTLYVLMWHLAARHYGRFDFN